MAGKTVEEIIKSIKVQLSKSNDVTLVLNLFSSLVDSIILNEKIYEASILEKVFEDQIKSRLKWNSKNATKIQKKLEFYRIMARFYESEVFENPNAAINCYRFILTKFTERITRNNFHQLFEQFNMDFKCSWKIVSKHDKINEFMDILQLILDRYESQNLPKEIVLHDEIMSRKAEYLRAKGSFQESLEVDDARLEMIRENVPEMRGTEDYAVFLEKLFHTLFKVMCDCHDIGQSLRCVEKAQTILNLFQEDEFKKLLKGNKYK